MTTERKVSFAIAIPQVLSQPRMDPASLETFLTKADALGYHSAWVLEQILGHAASLEPVTLVDLYFYAREIAPLEQVFARFREKYRGVSVDVHHLLRSLTFFDDAEGEAMPELVVAVTWDEIKAFFRTEAARLFREL